MIVSETFTHADVQGFKFGRKLIGSPTMYAIVYYVDGLLIDTGQIRMAQQVFQKVHALPVKQMVVTHYHEDHTGNLPLLQPHFNCEVLASQRCIDLMQAPPPISFVQKVTWGNRPAFSEFQPIPEQITTEKYTFQVIPIPGHAEDMIALYEPTQGWLFSADLFLHTRISYFLYNESMAQQIASLKRALALDFEVLFCSHNPKFTQGKSFIQEKLNFLEGFYEAVSIQHEKGRSAKAIQKQLQFKENYLVKWFSGGDLSAINMIKSVIRDLKG